jgi:hypothetical protein
MGNRSHIDKDRQSAASPTLSSGCQWGGRPGSPCEAPASHGHPSPASWVIVPLFYLYYQYHWTYLLPHLVGVVEPLGSAHQIPSRSTTALHGRRLLFETPP